MSRPYTVEEVREQFLSQIRLIARYWANQPNQTNQERCDGVAFSILNIFDGTNMALPAFDIAACPHPDDKKYFQSNNENWYEKGMVINECMLHEQYYKQ